MSYERCKSCMQYSLLGNCCLINGVRTPIVMDSVECHYYERNENMMQNETKKIKKKSFSTKGVFGDVPKADDIANYSVMDNKEKSQAELLSEAMHQQTMDVVNGYLGHADMVNHPPHYADSCSLECIESMEIAFGIKYTAIYCLINAYKYLWRRKAKNGSQDVKKALWYLDRFEKYYDVLELKISDERIKELFEKVGLLRNIADVAMEEYGEKENEK